MIQPDSSAVLALARRVAAVVLSLLALAPTLNWTQAHGAMTGSDAFEQELPYTPSGERSILPSAAELAGALPKKALIPIAARTGAFTTAPVTPLTQIVNGNFDGSGGWTQLQNEQPFVLVSPATVLGPADVTTQPNIAWLGGGCGGCIPPTIAAVHRLIQTVQLPADYAVSLQFDSLIQSSEDVCGNDTAALLINGAQVNPAFDLCRGPSTGFWQTGITSLAPWIGQQATIEFRVVANSTWNSNLRLDNVRLCGHSARLPLASQCATPPWRETPPGSARGGGVSATPGRSLEPALAVTDFNRPYLVWSDTTGGQSEILARRWNGEAWEAISADGSGAGNISANAGQSTAPAIAVDQATARSGEAWVAWHDATPGQNEIYVRRWKSDVWQEAGGSASGGGVSNTFNQSFGAAIAVGGDGVPYVAWTEDLSGADYEIYVRRWTGSTWAEAGTNSASGGGVSNNGGDSDNVSIAVAPDGTVYVAWADRSDGDSEIYVRRWKAGMTAWQEVGSGSASGGGVSDNDATSYAPSLAVAADGVLFVAWIDRDATDTEIYVKRWTEAAGWNEVGNHSATGGGVSNNGGSSLDPSLAIAPDGRPWVAWSDLSGDNAEIFLRRWNGSVWAEVGVDSAGYLGISATAGFSATPGIAVGRSGRPWIAWSDNSASSSNPEVFLRRYAP